MYNDLIRRQAEERGLSLQDAAQVFLQVIVLRHLSDPKVVFMGGTALVFGYGNPRFSEDVDLTQVKDPESLRPGLVKARAEIENWFAAKTLLQAPQAPKTGARTWRLTVRLGRRAESLSLHVDSQPFKAHTTRPIVVTYPSLQPIVIPTLSLEEIPAEKILAVAGRRYLGGRDLFDLWFHWLRKADWEQSREAVQALVQKKRLERRLKKEDVGTRLSQRLSPGHSLDRARQEWGRYLPREFQRTAVYEEIIERCRFVREILG